MRGALHHERGGYHFMDIGRTFMAVQLLNAILLCESSLEAPTPI